MLEQAAYSPSEYTAPGWLRNPHLHTLVARTLRARRAVSYRRKRVTTPDGDFLDLDYLEPDGLSDRAHQAPLDRPDAEIEVPLAVVLHGLEGSSHSGYVVEAGHHLANRGFRVVAMNFRSRSGEINRRPGSYHAGRTEDLECVVDHLEKRHPGTPLVLVGFSLGGNLVLKYLGERGASVPGSIRAAAVVSVPFDLSRCADRMDRGLGRLYATRFLLSLKRTVRAKAEQFPDAYDLPAVRRAGTMRAFDDVVTARVHGFRDVDHYYAECSSGPYLDGIRVATLIVQALDDPLVPADSLPATTIRDSQWLQPAITERGGHVGFVTGRGRWHAGFWAEREVARFLEIWSRNGRDLASQ